MQGEKQKGRDVRREGTRAAIVLECRREARGRDGEREGRREGGQVDRGQLRHTWKEALTKRWCECLFERICTSLSPSPPPPPLPPSATHPPAVSLSSLLFLSASMRLLPPPSFPCATLSFMLCLQQMWGNSVCACVRLCMSEVGRKTGGKRRVGEVS